eukprot:891152-Rhodomonas_salina.1
MPQQRARDTHVFQGKQHTAPTREKKQGQTQPDHVRLQRNEEGEGPDLGRPALVFEFFFLGLLRRNVGCLVGGESGEAMVQFRTTSTARSMLVLS